MQRIGETEMTRLTPEREKEIRNNSNAIQLLQSQIEELKERNRLSDQLIELLEEEVRNLKLLANHYLNNSSTKA